MTNNESMQSDRYTENLAFLRSRSLPILVQEEVERLIMTGALAVGSRINESELALQLSTSRGPVREALRLLEEAGLVRTEKNRGVFVREIDFDEADEIYELREVLEELIGRRATRTLSPDRLDRLRAMLAPMQAAAQARNLEQYALLNLQFHETLLEASDSKMLIETYRRLIKQLSLFRMRALDSGGGLSVSVNEHREIVDAISSGDAERAGRVMRDHVAASRARMRKAFASVEASEIAR